jgi:peptidoglycan/LPS O-acetylase OafA/YrhL
MMSWYAKNDEVINFYIRRLFRIVPLFWLGLIIYAFPTYWSFSSFQWEPILYTAFFINGWSPDYFNRVVPGGWSIAVEMNFYFIFPLLAFFSATTWGYL